MELLFSFSDNDKPMKQINAQSHSQYGDCMSFKEPRQMAIYT